MRLTVSTTSAVTKKPNSLLEPFEAQASEPQFVLHVGGYEVPIFIIDDFPNRVARSDWAAIYDGQSKVILVDSNAHPIDLRSSVYHECRHAVFNLRIHVPSDANLYEEDWVCIDEKSFFPEFTDPRNFPLFFWLMTGEDFDEGAEDEED